MEYPKSVETPKGWQVVRSKAEEAEIIKRFKPKKQKNNAGDNANAGDNEMTLELDADSLNHVNN